MTGRIIPLRILLTICVAALLAAAPARAQDAEVDVHAFVEISRPHVYVNEVFDLTLVIEAFGAQLAQSMQLQSGPEKDRLVLTEFANLPEERSIRNGKVFIRRKFRCAARASGAGQLTIAPSLVVNRLQRVRAFIGTAWQETPQLLKVKPLTLSVLALPAAGRPAKWSGAIGQFKLKVSASPTSVSPGDLVTLRSEIIGQGYTQGMRPPDVTVAEHFKTYEPTPVSETSDSHVFKQVVIPQSTHATAVPAVYFCFFDPVAGAFKTVSEGPFPLTFQRKTIATVTRFNPEVGPISAGRAEDTTADASEYIRRGAMTVAAALALLSVVAGGINLFRRRFLRVALWIGGSVLCCSVLWGVHAAGQWNPRTLRISHDTSARLAPSQTALICVQLSEGAEITIAERQGAWLRVRHKDSAGWVPAEAVEGQ